MRQEKVILKYLTNIYMKEKKLESFSFNITNVKLYDLFLKMINQLNQHSKNIHSIVSKLDCHIDQNTITNKSNRNLVKMHKPVFKNDYQLVIYVGKIINSTIANNLILLNNNKRLHRAFYESIINITKELQYFVISLQKHLVNEYLTLKCL